MKIKRIHNSEIENNLQDKVEGLIFGQAIGDALGLSTEFMKVEEVKMHYPNGIYSYSDIVRDKHRSRWEVGDWTDDTDQMLCILDSIIEIKRVDINHIAQNILNWYRDGGMGVGTSTNNVLRMPNYASNPHKAAEIVWNMGRKRNASNGAIMRTSILGIWEYKSFNKIKTNTENICKITHYDPRCVGSCVIITYIISCLLNDVEIILETLIKIANQYDNQIEEYIIMGYQNDLSYLDLGNETNLGYTLKTMSAAIWALNFASDFNSGIQQIILEGGDADTNAAVVGSVLGAKFGYSSLPNNLINELLHKSELEEKIGKLMPLLN